MIRVILSASRALRLPVCCLTALLFASLLCAQGGTYVVTPDKATIVVGESRRFRLVDVQGNTPKNVSWVVSSTSATGVVDGNELVLTGAGRGDVEITARAVGGGALATVKILDSKTLPMGTTRWSVSTPAGCINKGSVQAESSVGGPDIYQTINCPDGAYVQAYTSDGVLLWRRKMGAERSKANTLGQENSQAPAHLNLNSTSVCDRLTVGTDQESVSKVLKERGLSYTENLSKAGVWLVEEPGVKCKLSFDDKALLSRKQKILTTD